MDLAQFSTSRDALDPCNNNQTAQARRGQGHGDDVIYFKPLVQEDTSDSFLMPDSPREEQGEVKGPRHGQKALQQSTQLHAHREGLKGQLQNSKQIFEQARQNQQHLQDQQPQQRRHQQLQLLQPQQNLRSIGYPGWQQPGEEQETQAGNRGPDQRGSLPFPESFHDMTVHDLFVQCQNHLSVINSCTDLQLMVKEEMKKQAKLDSIIYHKLTTKAHRLQQQALFLGKVQAPIWVKVILDELSAEIFQQAQVHQMYTTTLAEQCFFIQCFLDDHHELIKSMLALQDGKEAPPAVDLNESKAAAEEEKKQASQESDGFTLNFLQASNIFEGIRKPWMKFISLTEYQQEQFNTALEQLREVDNELASLSKADESDNLIWRLQLRKKDLEIRREFLETRKEHLWKELNNAKKDLNDFELNHKDNVMKVVNVLRDQCARYDSNLRQSFELLKTASLRDPAFQKLTKKQDTCVETDGIFSEGTFCSGCKRRDPWNTSVLENSPVHGSNFAEKTAAESSVMPAGDNVSSVGRTDPGAGTFLQMNARTRTRPLREARPVVKEPIRSSLLSRESEFQYSDTKDIGCVYLPRTRYRIDEVGAFDTLNVRSPSNLNFSRTDRDTSAQKLEDTTISISAKPSCNSSYFKSANNAPSKAAQAAQGELKALEDKFGKPESQVTRYDPRETSMMTKYAADKDMYDCQSRSYQSDLAVDGIYLTCSAKTRSSVGTFGSDANNDSRYSCPMRETPHGWKEKRIAHLIEKYTSGGSGRGSLIKTWNGIRPVAWGSGNKTFAHDKANPLDQTLDVSTTAEPHAKSGGNQDASGCGTAKDKCEQLSGASTCKNS